MRYLTGFILLILSITTEAQFLEFGAGLGGFNYSGDLVRGYQITNVKPGISIQHRMNFSEYISLKWALGAGKLSGSDRRPIDAFARERDASFNINMVELSSVVEYHFLDFRNEKSIVRWSPYAFMGFAFFRMSDVGPKNDKFNLIQPAIPVGLGFKHLVGKRFVAGLEFGARFTFFDYLDNISDGDIMFKDYQYGNPNDNDRYYYFEVSFCYILWDIPCPFPYRPNSSMLKR